MTITSIRWDMILGGFGLFMFGIQFMGNGLKSVAGDQMREYVDKYTSNPFSAVLIGFLITILMQSSSASTAITIGFVRAGLMNLEQAAGIVMGANIGTTVTSFLISLNIDKYSLYIVFLGTMLICFSKKRKIQYLGNVILGFGLIFFGLSAMGDTLASLKDLPEFSAFALKMSDNSILSMITGAIMTGVVQSSAATIGVIQKLYAAGAISLQASLPFMFGANIGTTITGLLASMGGSLSARRTAGLHTLINLFATVIGMLILKPYTSFIISISASLNLNEMMQIAVANIIFKTLATIVFFPFLKQLVKVVCIVIPGKEPERPEVNIDALDSSVATVLPAAAIGEAEAAIEKMFEVVQHAVKQTKEYTNSNGKGDKEILSQNESMINNCDKKITQFLVKVSVNASIPPREKELIRLDLETVKNLERIGDLSMNVSEFIEMVNEDNGNFSAEAHEEINKMFDLFQAMFTKTIEIYKTKDKSLYDELSQLENELDKLEFTARQNHFTRMENNECKSSVASSIFCDILGNLERMGDHCCNIAKTSLSLYKTDDSLF